jgi:hypothetical protein
VSCIATFVTVTCDGMKYKSSTMPNDYNCRAGMFVKSVFIVPISSAIVKSLFSRCASCPSHSSRLTLEVLMRSAQVRLHPWQDAREHGGKHQARQCRSSDIGAVGRHWRRSPPFHPGLHAAGPGRPRADLGLSVECQLPLVIAYYRISLTNYHLLSQPLEKLSMIRSTFSSKESE